MNIKTLLPNKQEIEGILSQRVKNLPSLPVVALKLLKLVKDGNSSSKDLTRVIETDPAITSKVLRIANSAAFGLRQKIASINHAIVLLGFTEINSIALDVCLYEQVIKHKRSHCFNRNLFWRHCLSVAAMSKILAETLGYSSPEDAYVAGLLHDIGKIISDVYGKVTYCDILKIAESRDGLLLEIEKELGGLSHDDIGGYICADWGLPDRIVLAIRLHHNRFIDLDISQDDRMLIAIISLANFISWILGLSSVKMNRPPILQPEVEQILQFKEINFGLVINKVHQEIRDVAEFYDFSFPSLDQFRGNLLEANLQLSNITSKYYYLQKDVTKTATLCNNAGKSLLQPHRSLDPAEIIPMTLRAIHEDFHYESIYYLKIDSERRSLYIYDCYGDGAAKIDKKISIKIQPNANDFVHCLRDKLPALLVGATKEENDILNLFDAKEMGLVPVCNNNKIIGLLGIDNKTNGIPIDPRDLSTVAIVANELGMALENAKLFDEVKHLAYTDVLTNIHNRAYVNNVLDVHFKKAHGGGDTFSVGIVDVDYFKKFNDSFGHQTGDFVLKLLARTMKKITRPTDCIGRFGGEEFVFILTNSPLSDTTRYADRLRKEVEKLGKLLQKRLPGRALTVSIGVTTYHSGYAKVEEMIADADRALYRAKKGGRNLVMRHDPSQESDIVPITEGES